MVKTVNKVKTKPACGTIVEENQDWALPTEPSLDGGTSPDPLLNLDYPIPANSIIIKYRFNHLKNRHAFENSIVILKPQFRHLWF